MGSRERVGRSATALVLTAALAAGVGGSVAAATPSAPVPGRAAPGSTPPAYRPDATRGARLVSTQSSGVCPGGEAFTTAATLVVTVSGVDFGRVMVTVGTTARIFPVAYRVAANGGGVDETGVSVGALPGAGLDEVYGTARYAPDGFLGSWSGRAVDLCAALGS